MCNGDTRRRRRKKEREEIFQVMMNDNFPKINVIHQNTDPGSSENTKQNKCFKITLS